MTEKLSSDLEQRFLDVEENLKTVRERIAEAAVKSGRTPRDITLLAATKTVSAQVINHGIELGIDHIGENRVQELEDKFDSYDLSHCELQFIGHLQTNKVKYLIGRVSMIQSVDQEKLAKEISRLSEKQNLTTDILIEVNIGHEPNKSGVLPQNLYELVETVSLLPGVRIRGLMAIPPAGASEKETMNYFLQMNQYFVDIKSKKIDNVAMDFLSMGMSADYPQAILAGANLVRVGTALFGPRNYNR
ncbi:Pyridoxal phosphate homeostasis protein [Caprobacter fermentans]|uniref:Pyridoxal phosphate homeostasis protein n=1 Tax=Caproicibacter fermentans TaxID=2576756 RepID=A0A6N8HYC0_9FIRM|nr:YggS family pyridoxal phosphate-dependent enzyme [Caproicibacter fermentans]MVB10668.1 Pyridoxal phosphate homeostasis protein [Caproicibacter fermentans]OCN03278.1 YggS family pyridoxal phosphate enzyme [Clostridium sp. W14A]QNK40901.1 YggS family pyridoxal phosphate-dependent enzyme [Caproicibacter fermentans]